MTIYDLLKNDHAKLQTTLDRLLAATEKQEREALITEVRDLLVPHSRAEEAVLYNSLRDMHEAGKLIRHSYQEHIKAESILRGLQVTEAVMVKWQHGVELLKKDITHHIAEEEGKVFPAARKALTQEDAVALGKAFEELKPMIGAGLLSSQIELMTNLMPQQFRKSFADGLTHHVGTGDVRQVS